MMFCLFFPFYSIFDLTFVMMGLWINEYYFPPSDFRSIFEPLGNWLIFSRPYHLRLFSPWKKLCFKMDLPPVVIPVLTTCDIHTQYNWPNFGGYYTLLLTAGVHSQELILILEF